MKPKATLLLLAACCIVPPLAATALFYFSPPAGTTNRGELVEPAPLPDGMLSDVQETSAASVWHLLAVGSGSCGPSCAQRLCMISQARLVNVGELPRIRLLWLVSDGSPVPAQLLHEPACGRELAAGQVAALEPIDVLDGVTAVRASAAQLAQLSDAASGKPPEDYIYIVDPQGLVMMRFREDAAVKDVAKDLGRLLRLSQRS